MGWKRWKLMSIRLRAQRKSCWEPGMGGFSDAQKPLCAAAASSCFSACRKEEFSPLQLGPGLLRTCCLATRRQFPLHRACCSALCKHLPGLSAASTQGLRALLRSRLSAVLNFTEKRVLGKGGKRKRQERKGTFL